MTEDWSDRINVITDPLKIIRCLRSSMIKDLTCNGFHKLAIDAIKKAIDPLTGNNPTKCKLSLNEIGGLNFSDDGNGLNILEGNLEQTTYVLTTMLAGEPPKDVQTYSSVNFLFNISPLLIATSAYFSIDTVSENCQYSMSCVNGRIQTPLHNKIDKNMIKGTSISVFPDPDIWGQCEIKILTIEHEIRDFIRKMKLKIDLEIP